MIKFLFERTLQLNFWRAWNVKVRVVLNSTESVVYFARAFSVAQRVFCRCRTPTCYAYQQLGNDQNIFSSCRSHHVWHHQRWHQHHQRWPQHHQRWVGHQPQHHQRGGWVISLSFTREVGRSSASASPEVGGSSASASPEVGGSSASASPEVGGSSTSASTEVGRWVSSKAIKMFFEFASFIFFLFTFFFITSAFIWIDCGSACFESYFLFVFFWATFSKSHLQHSSSAHSFCRSMSIGRVAGHAWVQIVYTWLIHVASNQPQWYMCPNKSSMLAWLRWTSVAYFGVPDWSVHLDHLPVNNTLSTGYKYDLELFRRSRLERNTIYIYIKQYLQMVWCCEMTFYSKNSASNFVYHCLTAQPYSREHLEKEHIHQFTICGNKAFHSSFSNHSY